MNFRHEFDQVFTVETVIAAAVFGIVVIAMVFAVVRYRAGRRSESSQRTEHPRVEAVYAAGLLVVALGVYLFTYRANGDEEMHAKPAVTISVTGFQWCWSFHYVSPAVTVTGDCLHGHYPTVVLPTGEPVQFDLTSTDVIHSFWVPEFRYKLDAFPSHRNHFETVIRRPGVWHGHCAQFCGVGHATMQFTVRAVPPQQFRAWLAQHAAGGAA